MLNLKILGIFLFSTLYGCQSFQPETTTVSEHPDLGEVFTLQVASFSQAGLEKEVWLDGETEVRNLILDSTEWRKELAFFKEINPNQSEYVGAFTQSSNGQTIHLVLKEGERGSLKRFSYSTLNGKVTSISATIHEDKDVYVHHKEIEANFSESLLTDYAIQGYQKIMLKDTIKFKIIGRLSFPDR